MTLTAHVAKPIPWQFEVKRDRKKRLLTEQDATPMRVAPGGLNIHSRATRDQEEQRNRSDPSVTYNHLNQGCGSFH